MSKNLRLGAASIAFSQPLYIESAASIVSQKEADGPLGDLFDLVCEDPMFGCDTWESAESTLQKETATHAISKAKLSSEDIHLMFAGDLLAQTAATCFGSAGLGIPFYGLYGACSTIGEALSLGSLALTAGFGTRVLCATSSHFASAEKEFRFPLGYGNQRPFSATWTVTGSGACILSTSPPGEKAPLRSGKGCAAITGLTAGRVMDYGLRDPMNMGGCMAPAACDTIARSFSDFGRTPSDYDAVFTGDLGIIGQKILLDLLEEQNIRLSPIHKDCGILIYDDPSQDTHAGGSGCGCSAVVLASYILPKIVSGEWKRILFVPTGALLSKVSFNEGDRAYGGMSMDYFNAFWFGGLICALIQILLDKTKLMPGRVMVLLVCSGALLSAVGIYRPLVDFAGAGASVPLIGFGHVLWEGMKKAIEEDGILGLFTGGFTACAAGVSSALIFSYLASLFFRPKMKK